jgi:RNA polymerase sigma-70 factor (ECF subfamily)
MVVEADTANPQLDLATIYRRYFLEVARWVRALGAAPTDVEDLTQEVFLVVRRKLGTFHGGSMPAWLYRIASLTVADHRRRAWFRHLFSRRPAVDLDAIPGREGGGPLEAIERKEARQKLHSLLARMSEKRRTAFALFEIEGYSGEEIAELYGVPVATVWTRLFHARREFLGLLALERDEE